MSVSVWTNKQDWTNKQTIHKQTRFVAPVTLTLGLTLWPTYELDLTIIIIITEFV